MDKPFRSEWREDENMLGCCFRARPRKTEYVLQLSEDSTAPNATINFNIAMLGASKHAPSLESITRVFDRIMAPHVSLRELHRLFRAGMNPVALTRRTKQVYNHLVDLDEFGFDPRRLDRPLDWPDTSAMTSFMNKSFPGWRAELSPAETRLIILGKVAPFLDTEASRDPMALFFVRNQDRMRDLFLKGTRREHFFDKHGVKQTLLENMLVFDSIRALDAALEVMSDELFHEAELFRGKSTEPYATTSVPEASELLTEAMSERADMARTLQDPFLRDTIPARERLFLMHGHGAVLDSNDFLRRSATVPPGCKLVVTSRPETIEMDGALQLVNLFRDESNREALLHPELRRNMDWLAKSLTQRSFKREDVYVFAEGMRMPNLQFSPLAYNDRGGLVQFPFRGPLRRGGEIDPRYESKKLDPVTLSKLLEQSLYPTSMEVLSDAELNSIHDVHDKFKISVSSLMRKFGPGVYYFGVCFAGQNFHDVLRALGDSKNPHVLGPLQSVLDTHLKGKAYKERRALLQESVERASEFRKHVRASSLVGKTGGRRKRQPERR
jgi:hypothetical protein